VSNLSDDVPTHYDVLGVATDATEEQIKRAYVRKARRYHPDGHALAPDAVRAEAEREMQALNVAWNVLRDERRRRRYDRSLERSAERTTHPTDRRSPSGRIRRPEPTSPAAALGSGFSYWLGGISGPAIGGHRAYSLRVTGARSLAPLAAFAPDRLVALHGSGASIGDADLVHLRDMTSLRVLDLSDTPVTDVGLLHLQGCVELETVWLWNTAITDSGLALLGRLPNVRQLGLGNTRVTDAGLAALRDLRRLRLLQLWGTNVRGPGLQHLHHLGELEMVTLPRRVRPSHRRRLRTARPAVSIV
jgi:hypothetical protein